MLVLFLPHKVIFPSSKFFVVFLKRDSHGLKHLMKNGRWCRILLLINSGNPMSYKAFASASPRQSWKIPAEELFSRMYLLLTFQATGFCRQLQTQWTEHKLKIISEPRMLLWFLVCLHTQTFGQPQWNYSQLILAGIWFFFFLKEVLKLFFKPSIGIFFFNYDSGCNFLFYKEGPDSNKIAMIAFTTKMFRDTQHFKKKKKIALWIRYMYFVLCYRKIVCFL